MQGLQLTYETLGMTRNEAAVDVLIAALDDADAANRCRALTALLSRSEARSPQQVLANWSKLLPDDLDVIRRKKGWMSETVNDALGENGEIVLTAIAAAEALTLTSALPQLVLLAESSASRSIRQRSSEAVVAIVQPLGEAARADRNQATVRGPVLARLADSVRRFSMHHNDQLVDAFLLVSTWGDRELRQMINDDGPQMDLLCKRLLDAKQPGVIDLLAGFVRRKKIPQRIGQIIQARADRPFRNALLQRIGSEISATVLKNLRDIGMPMSCRGGEDVLDEIAPEFHAPLIHLYVAANPDYLETLHVLTAAIQRGGPGVESAAAIGFTRCELPDIEFWMRAAVPVADGQEAVIASDANARLLKRLIDLLGHPDPSLDRGVRHVLAPLHAEKMLPKFESLRTRSRRRLGKVVMMVDPNAIERVRDALRHPVLSNRLEAIATADALAVVDLLSDSFVRIAREDHQEARMRAAEAMSGASNDVTLGLLQEMINLPACPVRDAALKAIERRQRCRLHELAS